LVSLGKYKCTDYDLKIYTGKDMDYLKKQIAIIHPTVIVFGGTFEFLKGFFEELNNFNLLGQTNGLRKKRQKQISTTLILEIRI
jgi:hypothetical protein